jgi:glycosyltransferase involved in cell wall biosynthesis
LVAAVVTKEHVSDHAHAFAADRRIESIDEAHPPAERSLLTGAGSASRPAGTSAGSRVAIFLPSFRTGGAERVAVMIANGLAERGHEVSLLVARDEGPNRATVSVAVSVISFGHRHTRGCILPLARWLRERRPAVMLSFMKHANLVAAAASSLSGSSHRLVLSERTFPSVSLATERWPIGAILALGIRWMYRAADAIVAVSESVAHDLCGTYKLDESLVTVIHNPVDVDRVRMGAREPLDERSWPRRPGAIIVFVGRLTRAKDPDTLLRAFAKAREATEATLVLLGDGELRPQVESQIRTLRLQDDVVLGGHCDNPYPAMAHASCLVLSSRWEGFPNVLLEAAAVGVPIVATDCPGGSREILQGVEGAELVSPGDVTAMADAMRRAVGIRRPVTALMRRAEDFGLDRVVTSYERILRLPLARRSGGVD